ncbi:sulfatase family protein [Coraliomargarita sp. W4R72]
MTKPNIIFLMTDQQRWDALGCVNSAVITPNIDQLAARGVRFSQAICQAPICVPSRNSMMFGMFPSQTGIRTNGCQWECEDDLPRAPLPELMRQAGYQTAGFGKTHWNHAHSSPGPSTRGFETRVIGQPRESELYEDGATMMGDEDPGGLAAYFAETDSFGAGEENASGYIGCRSAVPASQHRDGWVAGKCMDFINTDLDPERPLFLYLSFLKPHAGLNAIPEFEELYSLNDIPSVMPAPQSVNCQNHQVHAESMSTDFLQARRQEWLSTWLTLSEEDKKQTTLRYWANCSWLDEYLGQALQALETQGRLDNALIVFCSDHGDLMGERDHRFSKYCLYDSSIRVPLILAGSALPVHLRNTVNPSPAELADLLPTLCGLAGIEVDAVGRDLLDADSASRASFCEYHGSGFSSSEDVEAYAVRTSEWKLIRYRDQETWRGELYHLLSDPMEWVNLYLNPEYSSVRDLLQVQLDDRLAGL